MWVTELRTDGMRHAYGAACMGCQSACAIHRPNGTCARNVPSRIARRILLISVPYGHALVWRNHGTPCKSATCFFMTLQSWSVIRKRDTLLFSCHRGAEQAGGTAARGGGGDGGRRGRRQARCRRSGDGRYSDRAGRRQTAPHTDAAPRRNPPEPEMCRSEAEGRFGEAEPEGCASICGRGRSQTPSATGG